MTKMLLFNSKELRGVVYKVGLYIQFARSAVLVTNTITLAQLAGVSGLEILKVPTFKPLLAIATPTTGAMFFYGCGVIAGNNTTGKVFIITSGTIALSMKGVK